MEYPIIFPFLPRRVSELENINFLQVPSDLVGTCELHWTVIIATDNLKWTIISMLSVMKRAVVNQMK